jgi:hypothetical protein
MRRAWKCTCLASVMAFVALNPAQAQNQWLQIMREVTVFLDAPKDPLKVTSDGRVVDEKAEFTIGSGVIVGSTLDPKGPLWIVTARHVVSKPEAHWQPAVVYLRFAWFADKPLKDFVGIPIQLRDGDKQFWIGHPDPSVDLAAIPLQLPVIAAGRESISALRTPDFVSADEVYEGASVFIYGYPAALGAEFLTRPLLRSGIVAWVNPKDPVQDRILIDAPIFGGNSGGPVFTSPVGLDRNGAFGPLHARFLGVVSQLRSDLLPTVVGKDTVFEVITSQGSVQVRSQQAIGIGVIEPAARVEGLLKVLPR